MEKILPYKCLCGGTMKESVGHIEQLGIDFGLKPIEVCTKCGEEYISNEVMIEIENKCKKLGLFGLERKVKVTKSGNSLVIRIPPDIAKFVGFNYKTILSLLPIGKGKVELCAVS